MEKRPNPDELLSRVREEDREKRRGKLTIFFGAAPGVGKTHSMLESARIEMEDEHRDVVVGVCETHGRYETGALLIGLSLLPKKKSEHRGVALEELDLEGALARRPDLILVDELAHTNAPGSRHKKRWQDVIELCDAGIDVFTTLNVQHLESLNDVVAQVTHVIVRETVPDSVFDTAHEVRVVDLPTGELLDRLREGKVYLPDRAARAAEHFFNEGNLIALRELALRRTAERVEAKMRGYKAAHGIEESWHTGERVLVCVSPSPHSARLVRAARRMATSLHAELVGLYVETPASIRLSAKDRERISSHMRLVESLGGEPVTVRAEDAAEETVQYARKRNVTKIVVGKPTHPRWRDFIRASFLDDLVRKSREIDVYVIAGGELDAEQRTATASSTNAANANVDATKDTSKVGYVAGAAIVATTTVVAWLAFGRTELADVAMTLLLGVVVVAMRFGYGPSIFAAVLSVFAFDFFFVPPYMSFAVSDFRHVVTFGVMFVVALVISHLTKRIREQADRARDRETRTASLFSVSRELGQASSKKDLLEIGARHVREVFGAKIALFLPANGALEVALADDGALPPNGESSGVAEWVWKNEKPAGTGTDTLPLAGALFVPLKGSRGRAGVLAVQAARSIDSPDERQLLDTLATLIGSALERSDFAEEAREARVRAETEQLRNALLSSVSHDLRTPLGVVTGATSALLYGAPVDEAKRRELLLTAHEEAQRLNRLVQNLLDMTKLEAGALKVHRDPQALEDVVGSALVRMDERLEGRDVQTDLAENFPLVSFDPVLIEQVLLNLIENALKYSPAKSPLTISARAEESEVVVTVADRGAGIAEKDRERVFDKFYRVRDGEGGGAGLGLTICRGIVSAHGGRIWVDAHEGGGAAFHFTLPRSDHDQPAPREDSLEAAEPLS